MKGFWKRTVVAAALVPLSLGAAIPRAIAQEPTSVSGSDTLTVYGEAVRPEEPRGPRPDGGAPSATSDLSLPGPSMSAPPPPAPTTYPAPAPAEGTRPGPAPRGPGEAWKFPGWLLLLLIAGVAAAAAGSD